jgi:flagellar assembly factor FliW
MNTIKSCKLSGFDEEHFVDSLAESFKSIGYKVLKQFNLGHGVVDLVLVSPRNVLSLYEVKISAKLGDVAQALGQLLIYRAQFKAEQYSRVMCILMVYDCMDTGTYNFLRQVCRTHHVVLSVCKRCEADEA